MSEAHRNAIAAEVVRIFREERLRRGFSMERLASDAGLSLSMISLVERDLRNPSLETLMRISGVLELKLSDVLLQAESSPKAKALEKAGKRR